MNYNIERMMGLKYHFLSWFYGKFRNPYKIDPRGRCPVKTVGQLPDGLFYDFRARLKRIVTILIIDLSIITKRIFRKNAESSARAECQSTK
jgi:hypothetical protein